MGRRMHPAPVSQTVPKRKQTATIAVSESMSVFTYYKQYMIEIYVGSIDGELRIVIHDDKEETTKRFKVSEMK
jgi:hypothetical protein